MLGQPFVAAEVVFIALVGEVLEASPSRGPGAPWAGWSTRRRARRGSAATGSRVEIPAEQVAVGDLVIVRPGERIPVDGPVVAGRSTVDQSALTGESMPVDKGPGDPVFTGTLNQFGVIEVGAEKVGRETTFGQVLRLVAQAQRRKAPLERTADRLARYFLPAVEMVAGATLLAGYLAGWPDVWSRTVAVLVVACPCALVLATPAAMLASMAWLARHGVLIKGGSALERLAACDTFAFDKTGTLTKGTPEFSSLVAAGRARPGRGAAPGRGRRAGQPPSPGRGRRRRRRAADRSICSSRSRPPSCPAPAFEARCVADQRRVLTRSWSATAGSWPSTASRWIDRPSRRCWASSTTRARPRCSWPSTARSRA